MIPFEIIRFFIRIRKRSFIVGGLLLILSLFSFLFFDDVEIKNPSIWDFFISTFSHQFISLVFFPALYLFLTADLVTHDLKETYTLFILSRTSCRGYWYIAKIWTLFLTSFLFIITATIIWLVIGSVRGLSWDHSFAHPVFLNAEQMGQSPFLPLILMIFLYIWGLTVLGTFVLLISIWFGNSVLGWVFAMVAGIASITAFNMNRDLFVWLPMSQLMFKEHFPYGHGDDQLHLFTISWSGLYMILVFLFSVITGFLHIRQMDLAMKDQE